jgi:DNA repair protein RecN (Recombination protein N)
VLRELVIKDFAIIDRLELSLSPGLSVLTGETGAGKSILVDAISALLGGKAGAEFLRDGADATVEGAFDIADIPELKSALAGLGLDDGPELILRRVISSGRSRAFVNGSLVNIPTLQGIGDYLVDIHGQHEHQSLLKVDTHIGLLDCYCQIEDSVKNCRDAHAETVFIKKKLEGLKARERERAQRLDLLLFQKNEIDTAAPEVGEEAELKDERLRLVHADKLKALALGVLDSMMDADNAVLPLIGDACKSAREVASLVPAQEEAAKLLESAEVSVREACLALRDFGESLEADPDRLSEIEGRLDTLSKLRKKYGEDIAAVLVYREKIEEELSSIEHAGEELSALEEGAALAEAALKKIAAGISPLRESGAKAFSKKVEKELAGLGMEKARFEAKIDRQEIPGPRGYEKVEFLFCANPGEALKPLTKIASGGELSRVMLALKVILSRADSAPTLIFDEVDSGVGGVTANSLGKKLREAAAGRQVLCITHLPQVASAAEWHYMVEKTVSGGRTKVSVRRLGKDDRIGEVARMLGGASQAASAHAEEMVKQGELYG